MNVRAWILATRPKTLSAAIVPVVMAAALAVAQRDPLLWPPFFFALAGSILIQIATNFVNDALDFKKGADTGERLGPLRVTQAGLLSADAVLRGAWVSLALAALCGIPLIMRGGWPLLAIGLASILAAYAYTGGPYPLAYHGLGEIFVILFFGLAAVGGTYYVMTLRTSIAVIVLGLAAGSLATVLLVINNLRDIETDRKSNKKTMAARFGATFAKSEVVLFSIVPLILSAVVAWLLSKPLFLITWLALPLVIALIRRCMHAQGAELNPALALAGAYQWAYGVLFVIGALVR
jgi:1,4-dihydroxy-2-naphthoate octaprenyltransferase